MILKSVDVSQWDHHAYGAVIDKNGILWSSGHNPAHVLRFDPSTGTISRLDIGHEHVYGLGLDYLDHLFVSAWTYQKLSRLNVVTGFKDWTLYKPELLEARGVACTSDNHVWVATTSPGMVYRYDNDGTQVAGIYVGSPTGVAVDAAGKVWSCNLNDDYITRIDPAKNMGTVDLSKRIIGSGGHYTYSDMTGIVSRTITTKTGTWTVVYDSGVQNMLWGTISWTSLEPQGTLIAVEVSSSNNQTDWSALETAANGVPLTSTPNGRYLKITTTLRLISGETSPVLYDLTVKLGAIAVGIDIKPGSYPNAINLGSLGVVPVAILSRAYFDATTVNPDTVELAGARVGIRGKGNKYMAHAEDVNGDGLVDLVVQVETINFNPEFIQGGYAILTGKMFSGIPIKGKDEIIIVPSKQ
jgi:hypothetical protein